MVSSHFQPFLKISYHHKKKNEREKWNSLFEISKRLNSSLDCPGYITVLSCDFFCLLLTVSSFILPSYWLTYASNMLCVLCKLQLVFCEEKLFVSITTLRVASVLFRSLIFLIIHLSSQRNKCMITLQWNWSFSNQKASRVIHSCSSQNLPQKRLENMSRLRIGDEYREIVLFYVSPSTIGLQLLLHECIEVAGSTIHKNEEYSNSKY